MQGVPHRQFQWGYQITNVRVAKALRPGHAGVAFSYAWRSAGDPSAQKRIASAFNANGQALGTQEFGFLALDAVGASATPGNRQPEVPLSDPTGAPKSAAVECSPI
jgi:hypothetical protein